MKSRLIIALAAATAIAVGLGAGSFAWFTSTATSTNNTFQAGTLKTTGTFSNTWTAIASGSSGVIVKAALSNWQCGSTADYTFSVNNTGSSLNLIYKNTLSNLMKNDGKVYIDNTHSIATNSAGADLLNGCLYNLTITRTGNFEGFAQGDDENTALTSTDTQKTITLTNLNIDQLKDHLGRERAMKPEKKDGSDVVTSDNYTVTVTLPNVIFAAAPTPTSSVKIYSYSQTTHTGTGSIDEDNDYQGAVGGFAISSVATQDTPNATYSDNSTLGKVQ